MYQLQLFLFLMTSVRLTDVCKLHTLNKPLPIDFITSTASRAQTCWVGLRRNLKWSFSHGSHHWAVHLFYVFAWISSDSVDSSSLWCRPSFLMSISTCFCLHLSWAASVIGAQHQTSAMGSVCSGNNQSIVVPAARKAFLQGCTSLRQVPWRMRVRCFSFWTSWSQ